MMTRKMFKQITVNCGVCGKIVHQITSDRIVLVSEFRIENYLVKCKECLYDEK
jgi:uncharacterized Zn finger protein